MAMTKSEVGRLVLDHLRARGWTRARLARESGLDPNTVGDLVRGARETSNSSRLLVERALGWPDGAMTALELGTIDPASLTPDVLPRTDESPAVSGRPPAGTVYLPPEVESQLTEAQAAEVRAHAYAEAMRRRREILNGA